MLERNQIQRLLDIAFLGCQKGHPGFSRQIVDGLALVLEDSVELEICRAMSYYTVDQFDAARDILAKAGQKFPGHPMILVHEALVDILMENRLDAQEKLNRVFQSEDDAARNLAKTLSEV